MTVPAPKPVNRKRDFPLCGAVVQVLEYEGTVQLGVYTDGWPVGRRALVANVFVDSHTPDELAAILRHLKRLALPDRVDPQPAKEAP